MKELQIVPGKTYIGHNGKMRTVTGYGANESYVVWAKTETRLPYGGFTDTRCTSRLSFSKWADREVSA